MTPSFATMSPLVGWLLAIAALGGGYAMFGWPGLLLAITMVVFWLLLQLSRALRAVRNASDAPVGRLRNAVMLNARLRRGMTLAQVLALTGSLGVRVEPSIGAGDEAWRWTDAGGIEMTLTLREGRLAGWEMRRPHVDV